MKRVKRTADTIIPKQPFINWADSVDDGHVNFGDNPSPEHTIYLAEDITDYVVDTVEIIKQMAIENPRWGAKMICGELLKLGISVHRSTTHAQSPQAKFRSELGYFPTQSCPRHLGL